MTETSDMTRSGPLRLDALPPALVERVRDGLILPVGPDAGVSCGVFRADQSFCELSRTRISDSRFTQAPAYPETPPKDYLEGRYLFGGIGRHHFGHFVLETLARLWALDGRQQLFDGLIVLPMHGTDFGAILRRRMLSFLQVLGVDMPIHLVRTPIRVEHLYLPGQGIGHLEWAVGHDDFRRYMRHQIDLHCRAIGPDKLYISRAKLKRAYQRIDQEERIERLMKSAGYTVLHPQRHSISAQCQIYRAAHTIVGGDGSAFHLAPLAMQAETRVGLIQRRARSEPVDAIANQINAFARVDLVRLNPVTPEAQDDPLRKQATPISFRALKEQLEAAHLI